MTQLGLRVVLLVVQTVTVLIVFDTPLVNILTSSFLCLVHLSQAHTSIFPFRSAQEKQTSGAEENHIFFAAMEKSVKIPCGKHYYFS